MHYEIPFYGHKNIRSTHQKTIEITTDPKLSTNGNCIIGVKSNSGCNGIPITMKAHLRNSNSDVTCTISVDQQGTNRYCLIWNIGSTWISQI